MLIERVEAHRAVKPPPPLLWPPRFPSPPAFALPFGPYRLYISLEHQKVASLDEDYHFVAVVVGVDVSRVDRRDTPPPPPP